MAALDSLTHTQRLLRAQLRPELQPHLQPQIQQHLATTTNTTTTATTTTTDTATYADNTHVQQPHHGPHEADASPHVSVPSASSSSSSARVPRDYPGIICNHCRLTGAELCRRSVEGTSILARCSGCRAVFYDSKACQKADWPQHKLLCRQVRSLQDPDRQNLGYIKISKNGSSKNSAGTETSAASASAVHPSAGDCVSLHYIARLANGTVVDRSFTPSPTQILHAATQSNTQTSITPTPYTVTILSIPQHTQPSLQALPITHPPVIPGLALALLTLTAGEHATLLISAAAAYGEAGVSGLIPPKSVLLMEVECIGWRSKQQREQEQASEAQLWQQAQAWTDGGIDELLEQTRTDMPNILTTDSMSRVTANKAATASNSNSNSNRSSSFSKQFVPIDTDVTVQDTSMRSITHPNRS